MLSPRITRARTRPNLNVSEDQYKNALHALLVAAPPMVDLKTRLGPQLAKHQKQVTPGHLVSLEKFWHPLINNGCQQLVLQSQKIRSALHQLVHENSLLIREGTPQVAVPCIIDDVKQHIMHCASMMRGLKNAGMPGCSIAICAIASALKHKMVVGVHWQILGPIIEKMEFSDAVMNEPGMPCPLSPGIDLALIPQLPPSRLSFLDDCTPTKSAKLTKMITPDKVLPDKVLQAQVVDGVQGGDNTMCSGKGQVGDNTMDAGRRTRITEHDDVQSANDGPNVDVDCKLDTEVDVDECGYPTIFGSILMNQIALDKDGFPTIFGSILKGGDESGGVVVEMEDAAMECDEDLPGIKPINPNVRARKLEVNGVAKARHEDDLAAGIAPAVKKRLNSKQPVKTKTLKARMLQQWHQSEEDPQAAEASKDPHNKRGSKRAKCKPIEPKKDEPKAEAAKDPKPKTKRVKDKRLEGQEAVSEDKKFDGQVNEVGTACKKKIKHADAVIISAYGSSNASTGRYDIQGKVKLADGSYKNMGILGFTEKEAFGEKVWTALLAKMNDASCQHSKGDMVMLRDELILSCKAGQPC